MQNSERAAERSLVCAALPTPLFIDMDQHFGVRMMRPKAMPGRLKFGAEFKVVVYFAIVGHMNRALEICHRLRCLVSEIDD